MAQYKIQKGDTLWALSKRYGTTVDELARINNISNPNMIHTGNMLNIPGYKGTGSTGNTTSATKSQSTPNKDLNIGTSSKSNTNTNTGTNTNATLNSKYNQSQKVTDAYNKYQSLLNNKPEAYQSGYQEQIDQMLANIQNNNKFSYNVNADELYKQYKEQYTKNAQMAMKDTMANAAALSGGYGNSYASTAGQQAYNQYMGELANIIPELEQNAYAKYQNEQNERYNQLSALQNMENQAYNKYVSDYDIYNSNLSNAYNNYNSLYGNEYNEYLNALSQANTDREYQLSLDQYNTNKANADREYQLTLDQYNTNKTNADREYQLALRQYEDSLKTASSKSGSGSNTGYSDVLKSAEAAAAEGWDAEKIMGYLDNQVSAGVITAEEANYIADTKLRLQLSSLTEYQKENKSKKGIDTVLKAAEMASRLFGK